MEREEGKEKIPREKWYGSFYLNDYKFCMESSNENHKYRLIFTSKSENLEKKSKTYVFEPNTNADAHGWSKRSLNVMSRIRAKSLSFSDSNRKSLLKTTQQDVCRKKGLILTQNGEMSCPIRRSPEKFDHEKFSRVRTLMFGNVYTPSTTISKLFHNNPP